VLFRVTHKELVFFADGVRVRAGLRREKFMRLAEFSELLLREEPWRRVLSLRTATGDEHVLHVYHAGLTFEDFQSDDDYARLAAFYAQSGAFLRIRREKLPSVVS
jgi:hypothetical protein